MDIGTRTAGPRRRGLSLAVACLLVVGLAAAAVAAVTNLTADQRRAEASVIAAGQPIAARDALAANEILREARWLFPDTRGPTVISETRALPSLIFPPGTTYEEALTKLYVNLYQRGMLPEETTLAESLPPGKVVSLPSDSSDELQLSLTAPWGYMVRYGIISSPALAFPGDVTVEEANRRTLEANRAGIALPAGGRVDVPSLEPCQVMRANGPSEDCPAPRPLPEGLRAP